VEKIYRKFTGISDEQKIKLDLVKDIDNPIAIFDVDRMEQVLTNLIDNAISHTDENGSITVKVTNTDENLHVVVQDNGSGIPEEDLSFIFERFYKADKSRTRTDKKKGTGLGLAITKHIVSAHQGTISVKSKENEGTTFTFKIPNNKKKKSHLYYKCDFYFYLKIIAASTAFCQPSYKSSRSLTSIVEVNVFSIFQ